MGTGFLKKVHFNTSHSWIPSITTLFFYLVFFLPYQFFPVCYQQKRKNTSPKTLFLFCIGITSSVVFRIRKHTTSFATYSELYFLPWGYYGQSACECRQSADWNIAGWRNINIFNQFLHFKGAVKNGVQKFALCYLFPKHGLNRSGRMTSSAASPHSRGISERPMTW